MLYSMLTELTPVLLVHRYVLGPIPSLERAILLIEGFGLGTTALWFGAVSPCHYTVYPVQNT